MFRTSIFAGAIFWLMDVMNLPFMEKFDTTYPLNTVFYICVFLLMALITEIPVRTYHSD